MKYATILLAALLALPAMAAVTVTQTSPADETITASGWFSPCGDSLSCHLYCTRQTHPGYKAIAGYSDGVRCHCIWTRDTQAEAAVMLVAESAVTCTTTPSTVYDGPDPMGTRAGGCELQDKCDCKYEGDLCTIYIWSETAQRCVPHNFWC